MLDVIAIGDVTLDTFVGIKDATVTCSIHKEDCKLCLSYADKIPVTSFEQKSAGNAGNVAVSWARLGLRSAIYTHIGDDEPGLKIKRSLAREGVMMKYVHVDSGKPSNNSIVLNFQGERTILVYHHPRDYAIPKLEVTRWMYYTSAAPEHHKLQEEVVRTIRGLHGKMKLAFNPGTHQLKLGLKKLSPVLALTSVLCINKEEGERLVGKKLDSIALMHVLKKSGPEIVVVTDGPNGAYAYNGVQSYGMPTMPVKVVERTGAGDAFAAGYLAAAMRGEPMKEALRWGTANSAGVIQKVGPQAGLLDIHDMEMMLARFKKVVPKKLG